MPGLSGLVNKDVEGERRIGALSGPVRHAFVSVQVDEAVLWCNSPVFLDRGVESLVFALII